MKGWELVQVLQPENDIRYHLVFKTRRPCFAKSRAGKLLDAGGISLKAPYVSFPKYRSFAVTNEVF